MNIVGVYRLNAHEAKVTIDCSLVSIRKALITNSARNKQRALNTFISGIDELTRLGNLRGVKVLTEASKAVASGCYSKALATLLLYEAYL